MASGQVRLDYLAQTKAERAALARFDEVGQQWGGKDCKKILREWFPRLLERARKRKGAEVEIGHYEDEIDDAWWILDGLREAFSGNINRTLYDAVQDSIWTWPGEKELLFPPNNKWRSNSSPSDREELASKVTAYIERPWLQSDLIDGAAINAFLFSALSSAMDLYRMGAFGATDWSFVLGKVNPCAHPFLNYFFGLVLSLIIFPVFRWIMFPAVAAALAYTQHATSAEVILGLWIGYFLLRLATLKRRRRSKKDADRTASAMRAAWEHSCGEVINPRRLRELVIDAEEKGAINYPSVLHTLIDRAISRDPTALHTHGC
jgi:hypothetical protein